MSASFAAAGFRDPPRHRCPHVGPTPTPIQGVFLLAPLIEGRLPEYNTRVLRAKIPCIEGRVDG